eukprot:g14097.t1
MLTYAKRTGYCNSGLLYKFLGPARRCQIRQKKGKSEFVVTLRKCATSTRRVRQSEDGSGREDQLACNIYPSRTLKFADETVARPNPSVFSLPGLASKPFHDLEESDEFDLKAKVVDLITPELVGTIREECLAMREACESDYEINETEHVLHGGRWEWHSYILKGEKQAVFETHCPSTAEFLNSVDSLQTDIPFAYAFFSSLKPFSGIDAHYGPTNLRLRCHLPLVVPEDCGIVVGGESREWKEGELMIFDDSYKHHVYHHGSTERILLLFDIWHPQISEDEKRHIVDMFDQAKRQGWLK